MPGDDREDQTTPDAVSAALRALLEHVVDYAGVYPPASIDLPTAARHYASYRASEDRWMLGRFVIGVANLPELRAVVGSRRPSESPWPVTVVAPDAPAATAVIRAVDAGGIKIESIEVKATALSDIGLLARAADRKREVYVEVALDATLEAMLDAIGTAKLRAKVRTGGVTPESFPPAVAVVRFIRACITRGIPFKATAGLHHPLGGVYRLTDDTNGKSGPMLGFLNLFLATALMAGSLSDGDAVALLDESDESTFTISEQWIGWRDHVADLETIQSTRARLATSFGSCSFREPVDEMPFPLVTV